MLQDLIDKSSLQIDIFHQRTDEELDKKDKLMMVFDTINTRFGSHTIKLAAEWYSKLEQCVQKCALPVIRQGGGNCRWCGRKNGSYLSACAQL